MTDLKAEYLVFVGIGALVLVWGVLYAFTSYEDAGTTMLLVSAALLFFTGAYLFVQHRRLTAEAAAGGDGGPGGRGDGAGAGAHAATGAGGHPVASEEPWFPHSSGWSFGFGLSGFFLANGLVLGVWFLVPGALLLAASVFGYARQSRYRT